MSAYIVRPARSADIVSIRNLLQPMVEQRILLGKDLAVLYGAVQEFVVAEADGELIGCGALHVIWEDLGGAHPARPRRLAPSRRRSGDRRAARGERAGARAHAPVLPHVRGRLLRPSRLHPIGEQVVDPDVYSQLLRSGDAGVEEFLDLAHVKPNTLGNTRMLKVL